MFNFLFKNEKKEEKELTNFERVISEINFLPEEFIRYNNEPVLQSIENSIVSMRIYNDTSIELLKIKNKLKDLPDFKNEYIIEDTWFKNLNVFNSIKNKKELSIFVDKITEKNDANYEFHKTHMNLIKLLKESNKGENMSYIDYKNKYKYFIERYIKGALFVDSSYIRIYCKEIEDLINRVENKINIYNLINE